MPFIEVNLRTNAATFSQSQQSDSSHICSSGKEKDQHSKVSQPLTTLASWGWRFLIVIASALVIGWLALKFSVIIISILIALLVAVIIQPLAGFLKNRWHWPSGLAAITTLCALILFLLALLIGSGTGLYQGFADLGDKIIGGINTITSWLIDTFPQLQGKVDEWVAQGVTFAKNNAGAITGGVVAFGSSISTFATALVLVFFTLFFFLKDGRNLWHWFVRLWPERYRTQANEAGIRAWVTLGNYARTQAIVALFDSAFIAIISACLGTPISLVFPIGAIVFICAFIPVVGALLSGAVAVLVVLVVTGDWVMALIMLIGVLAVQQIEGNLLSPILQGNALNLHAWAILLLVLGGSMIAGVFGALFTVPFAAAINTVVLYLRGHDTYPYLNTLHNRPGGPPQDFENYTREHWRMFDKEIAQHLPPKEARQAKRARRKARRRKKAATTA